MARFNKILLTGINGQVGNALHHRLSALGEVIALDRAQLDISDITAIRDCIRTIKPNLIINPAAYTAVDKAESEPELAMAINGIAPSIIAEEARNIGALFVHYSTDYVFDGTKQSPYTESDTVHPLSVYGKTKQAGEEAIRDINGPHLIFRTSWVYGAFGKNFLHTILRLASERDHLRIVADQIGAPTSSIAIADATISALCNWQEEKTGTYHMTNSGYTSWHGFAHEIIKEYNSLQAIKNWPSLKATVNNIAAINTTDYPTPAHRPTNSRMDCSKLKNALDTLMPNWQAGLKAVLQSM